MFHTHNLLGAATNMGVCFSSLLLLFFKAQVSDSKIVCVYVCRYENYTPGIFLVLREQLVNIH